MLHTGKFIQPCKKKERMPVAGSTDSAKTLIVVGWLSYPPVLTVGDRGCEEESLQIS